MNRFLRCLRQPFSRIRDIDPDFFSERKFTDLKKLHKGLSKRMIENQMVYMTKAQSSCIDYIFKYDQTLNLAETGSGKTLMYLLPVLDYFIKLREKYPRQSSSWDFENNPRGALILTHSKELCNQIYRDIRALDPEGIVQVTRLGSLSMVTPLVGRYEEIKQKKVKGDLSEEALANYVDFKKMDMIITTPGQLETLIFAKRIKRLNLKFLIIDEADNLLTDYKNFQMLTTVLDKLDIKNQNLVSQRKIIMTAATFPQLVRKIPFEKYLKDVFPELKIIKSENYMRVPKDIEHSVVETDDMSKIQKFEVVRQLLLSLDSVFFLVFCNKNETVHELTEYLQENEVPALPHSALQSDSERSWSVNLFSTRGYTALVCSDAINRGIHFDFPVHIIQFEPATNAFNLMHRIGRTGRLGRTPRVTSMINKSNKRLLTLMQGLIGKLFNLRG